LASAFLLNGVPAFAKSGYFTYPPATNPFNTPFVLSDVGATCSDVNSSAASLALLSGKRIDTLACEINYQNNVAKTIGIVGVYLSFKWGSSNSRVVSLPYIVTNDPASSAVHANVYVTNWGYVATNPSMVGEAVLLVDLNGISQIIEKCVVNGMSN
jgi:hypothetical protein